MDKRETFVTRSPALGVVLILVLVGLFSGTVFAEDGGESSASQTNEFLYWGIAFAGSIVALIQAWLFYKKMMEADEGTPTMIEIAGHVREGAAAYLNQQQTANGTTNGDTIGTTPDYVRAAQARARRKRAARRPKR